MNTEALYRKTRWTRTFFDRWRVYSFRSHFDRGYTRHWFVYGRDENGDLERKINDMQLSAYRLRGWRLTADVTVSDAALGADSLRFHFALPFVGQVFLSFQNAKWLVRRLGLKYVIGQTKPDDCERTLGFSWNGSRVSLAFWANIDVHWQTRYRYFDLKDILLGRTRFSESERERHEATLALAVDVSYPVQIEFYRATWTRPRWPRPRVVARADLKVLPDGAGIPIPGKGESEYDLDDDAIFELTCKAETVDEALEILRESVVTRRERYGWPTHHD